MDGRGEQLDGCGRGELRDGGAAQVVLQRRGHALGQQGPEERGHVEGGEDGQAVAEGEEEVAGQGDGADGGGGEGPVGAHVELVFVDAQTDVGGARGGELGGPGGDVGGGLVAQGRGQGVEGVGG